MSRGKKDYVWNTYEFDELLSHKSVCLIKYEDGVESGLCGMSKQECENNVLNNDDS